jgi:hypothetical protein
MIRAALLSAFCLLALGACDTAKGPDRTPSEPDLNVTYEKTGGFLPFNDTLVVHGDGILAYTDRTLHVHDARVGPAQLERLRSLLSSPEFHQASPEYRAAQGADLVTHKIDARLVSSSKTVVVMDSTQHPKVLDQIIDELERLAGIAREH